MRLAMQTTEHTKHPANKVRDYRARFVDRGLKGSQSRGQARSQGRLPREVTVRL
jgi:hypothetical protein